MGEIILGLSHHRLEVIPHLESFLKEADLIILEEPENEKFEECLKGKLSPEEYLKSRDYAFPEYMRASLELFRKNYQKGKKFLQIEPYFFILEKIYEGYENGSVKNLGKEYERVYEMERRCTEKLLEFYQASLASNFDEIVEKVIAFSKVDAERFILRDEMRLSAILEALPKKGKVFIEAGTSHLYLYRELLKKLCHKWKVKLFYLLEGLSLEETGKRWNYPPGELLTLKHIFRGELREEEEKLLSARALIYIKIIPKEELFPTRENPYPHFYAELKAYNLVNKLAFEDCKNLYFRLFPIRDSQEGLRITQNYFELRVNKRACEERDPKKF